LYLRGTESEECCDETPLDGVLEFELGSDVRSGSIIGGLGLLDGLEFRDIADGDREDGKDDRDVLRLLTAAFVLPLELEVAVVSVVPVGPLVLGRCIVFFVALV
jgi:hypothetical protein